MFLAPKISNDIDKFQQSALWTCLFTCVLLSTPKFHIQGLNKKPKFVETASAFSFGFNNMVSCLEYDVF